MTIAHRIPAIAALRRPPQSATSPSLPGPHRRATWLTGLLGLLGPPGLFGFLALCLVPIQTAWSGVIELEVRGFRIQAELANTPDTRARGLMFRQALATDAGMVFHFERPERICMWMKNTPLPLTVAFVSADGVILNTADMQPQTLQPHCAAGPALYALEMSQGWFQNRGIGVGHRLSGLPTHPNRP